MRIGLALDLGSVTPVACQISAAQALLRTAEETGVDTVWVGESYHRQPEPFHLPAVLLVLAHLAAYTPLSLGAGVLLMRAYDPARLAYETALADQITDGRLTLGLGLGPAELGDRFGGHTRPRVGSVDTALRELRAAWSGDTVPAPTRAGGPRILVGGAMAASVQRAVALADGYYAATNYTDRLLARQAAAYWDRTTTGDVVVNRLCLIHPDGETARQLAARYLAPVIDYYTDRGLWKSTSDDTSPDVPALVGTPAEVSAALQHYADLGVTAVNLRIAPHGTPPEVAGRSLELAAGLEPVTPTLNR